MTALETWQLVLLLTPLSLITFAVIFGNLLVIIAVSTQKFLQTLSNLLLVSLAIADLCVGLFILPLNLHQIIRGGQWEFGAAFCMVWVTADMTLCSISIFNICLIAWDRYRSITDGVEYLRRRTLRSVLAKIAGIWFLALWISSPPLIGWSHDHGSIEGEHARNSTTCTLNNESGFVIHSALGSLIVPTIVMAVLYVKIYYTIQTRLIQRSKLHTLGHQHVSSIIIDSDTNGETTGKSARFAQSTADGPSDSADASTHSTTSTAVGDSSAMNNGIRLSPPSLIKSMHHSMQIQNILQKKIQFSLTRERRAAKILGIIMFSFIVCWLPFSLMYIIEPFLTDELKPSYLVCQSITWLGYINSALNPIIYTVFSTDFRKAFKRLLRINK